MGLPGASHESFQKRANNHARAQKTARGPTTISCEVRWFRIERDVRCFQILIERDVRCSENKRHAFFKKMSTAHVTLHVDSELLRISQDSTEAGSGASLLYDLERSVCGGNPQPPEAWSRKCKWVRWRWPWRWRWRWRWLGCRLQRRGHYYQALPFAFSESKRPKTRGDESERQRQRAGDGPNACPMESLSPGRSAGEGAHSGHLGWW